MCSSSRSVRRFSSDFKISVVQEYLSGGISKYGLCKKYSLDKRVLRSWILTFAPEPSLDPSMSKTSSESDVILELKRQLRQKELDLKREKMRADFYETMVDVAESQFNVPIRKKVGVKR